MHKIGIIDTHVCNLHSVIGACKQVDIDFEVVTAPDQLSHCSHMIIPGVGSFAKGMQHLKQAGLVEAIKAFHAAHKPILGICLGMQMLCEQSFELGKTKGLSLIQGLVRPLMPSQGFKIPHMGWQTVHHHDSPLFFKIPREADFYFAHSFILEPKAEIAAQCEYGGVTFPAAIHKENLYAVQFHPEKSGQYGMQLINNFFELC